MSKSDEEISGELVDADLTGDPLTLNFSETRKPALSGGLCW